MTKVSVYKIGDNTNAVATFNIEEPGLSKDELMQRAREKTARDYNLTVRASSHAPGDTIVIYVL